MHASDTNISSNPHAADRDAAREYLAELPILDRRVLTSRYADRKEPAIIALELRVTKTHVERILARARDFRAGVIPVPGHDRLPSLWNRSPITSL